MSSGINFIDMKKYNKSLFTIENLNKALNLMSEVTDNLLKNDAWHPFMTLDEELEMIDCDITKDRYIRSINFYNACAERCEDDLWPQACRTIFG